MLTGNVSGERSNMPAQSVTARLAFAMVAQVPIRDLVPIAPIISSPPTQLGLHWAELPEVAAWRAQVSRRITARPKAEVDAGQ